jgi:hypothetical protein
MVLPVKTVLLGPLYTTRVQAFDLMLKLKTKHEIKTKFKM